MAGKSTVLRCVAAVALLGNCGLQVGAQLLLLLLLLVASGSSVHMYIVTRPGIHAVMSPCTSPLLMIGAPFHTALVLPLSVGMIFVHALYSAVHSLCCRYRQNAPACRFTMPTCCATSVVTARWKGSAALASSAMMSGAACLSLFVLPSLSIHLHPSLSLKPVLFQVLDATHSSLLLSPSSSLFNTKCPM